MVGGVEVQQEGRQTEARAEHDSGREVAPAGSLYAEQLHRGDRDGVDCDEAPQRTHADEVGGRAAGRADVPEGLAREGLASDHRVDAEGTGDEGHQGPDRYGRVDRGVPEEPLAEDRREEGGGGSGQAAHETTWISRAWSASPSSPADRSAAPVTTSTRPWTRRTST